MADVLPEAATQRFICLVAGSRIACADQPAMANDLGLGAERAEGDGTVASARMKSKDVTRPIASGLARDRCFILDSMNAMALH